MTTEHYQLAIFILGFILVVWFVTDLFNWINKKKSRGVPNLRNIPPAPIQRYHAPRLTIETQYGRDLIHISSDIFSKNSEHGVDWAVNRAGAILIECRSKCVDVDIENVDKRLAEVNKKIAEAG